MTNALLVTLPIHHRVSVCASFCSCIHLSHLDSVPHSCIVIVIIDVVVAVVIIIVVIMVIVIIIIVTIIIITIIIIIIILILAFVPSRQQRKKKQLSSSCSSSSRPCGQWDQREEVPFSPGGLARGPQRNPTRSLQLDPQAGMSLADPWALTCVPRYILGCLLYSNGTCFT